MLGFEIKMPQQPLAFDREFKISETLRMRMHDYEQHEVEGETPFSERRLAALFGLHVDDLLGCGDPADPYFQEVKKTF